MSKIRAFVGTDSDYYVYQIVLLKLFRRPRAGNTSLKGHVFVSTVLNNHYQNDLTVFCVSTILKGKIRSALLLCT